MPTNAAPLVLAITLGKPGGATSFVFSFARWLKQQGEDVRIFVGEEGTWLQEQCKRAEIPIRTIPHLRRAIHPWHDLRATSSFQTALEEVRPRALHLNSSKAGVIGSLAGRLAGISPIVYCIGGWAALEARSCLRRAAYLVPEQISAPWKDTIVCLHPGDAQFAKDHSIKPKKSVQVIPNGINLDTFERTILTKQAARAQLGLSIEGTVIGTIANFYPAKDLPRYLETCAQICQQRPDIRFCLIGDGPERRAIEEVRERLRLQTKVILAGTREQASQFLRAFDLFVLPSKKEGMPFVLLEAAAAGLPIVTTDVGAHRWMLPEANIVPAQRPELLANAINALLDHPRAFSYKQTLERFREDACFQAHAHLLDPNIGKHNKTHD